MRVLVADDEYYARKALLKILAELDVEVAADMETGQEVIDYLERDSRVDAVLTDIRMPEINGLQVAEHISRSYPDVSVIIVTGYADFSYAQQALRFGVKDYVTKPLRRDSIKKALDGVSASKCRRESSRLASRQERDLEFSMEQLSVKELAQNADLQRLFCNTQIAWNTEFYCSKQIRRQLSSSGSVFVLGCSWKLAPRGARCSFFRMSRNMCCWHFFKIQRLACAA